MSVVTIEPGATPADEEPPDTGERHRLTAVTGLAALSLDAMASRGLRPRGDRPGAGRGRRPRPRVHPPGDPGDQGLLAVLVASYRQVIAAFPDGGGSYAVAKIHLGARTSLVAAASLVLDYVLNVAVAVTAGVAALTSAFPALYDDRLWLCLAVLALITAVNLRGIVESAKVFIVPTVVFVGSIFVLIGVGLFRSAPVELRPWRTGTPRSWPTTPPPWAPCSC
ncbi:APC family permease OS=Streptomyces alboniger OX=132473 GN=CP975_06655 PE=4 SV=1 [Streptomyces alboniger]